jgi:hypothetical protein
MQMVGSPTPTLQHSIPGKQLSGSRLHSMTRQLWLKNVSQKSASVPAQSAGPTQGRPAPSGGSRQTEGDELELTHVKPGEHSALPVQPSFVQ